MGDLTRPGAYAEYVLADERVVGKKPTSLSFSQSASLPLTSLVAMQILLDQMKVSTNVRENAGKVILVVGGMFYFFS